ncbi:sensor histidine kinase [Aminobacter sp. HY435]|uniref:sensor histidine kinase n=1 Tax=Aminobacter sp. HY435 TaxID=2970917 RepID=UPI0022B9BD19|nr:PAS domain-containing sensor histidine kinase [Aminobacter sp. HY435]
MMAAPPTQSDHAKLDAALLYVSRNAGIAVFYQDRNLRTIWSHNATPPWVAAHGDDATLPPQQADRLVAAKKNVIASGKSEGLEVSLADHSEGMRWYDLWIDADLGESGEVDGLILTIVETTEQKRREQTLRALLREVSHRSKNLLAIIQSIATQTGRYSGSIDTFLLRFRGRLQSIASSQDLVTSSNWRGAEFRELVVGQVGRYAANPQRMLRFSGEDPYLNPNAALHVGLAVHELAVNSVSYGALSRADGYIDVAVAMEGANGDARMGLSWIETIAPGTDAVSRKKKFGSVALERIVPAALNGTAELDIGPDKVSYRLFMPKSNFELE